MREMKKTVLAFIAVVLSMVTMIVPAFAESSGIDAYVDYEAKTVIISGSVEKMYAKSLQKIEDYFSK